MNIDFVAHIIGSRLSHRRNHVSALPDRNKARCCHYFVADAARPDEGLKRGGVVSPFYYARRLIEGQGLVLSDII